MATLKDYLQLHFIVLIWGFTAIIGLLITIPSVEIVFYRTLISFIALGILLYLRKRNFLLGTREIIKISSTGLLIAAHWILFFAAARVSTASVCLAGMATCTLWTSILEPVMTQRKIKYFEVMLGLIVIGGLYVIFTFEFNHALGLFMAIASAFLSSLFTVINGKFSTRHNPYMITFYEMIGACIGTVAFFPVYLRYFAGENQLQLSPSAMDWLYLAILAIICTVYAYSISVELMKRMSAFTINLTVNMEPVYGIILAYLIFREAEKMTSGFYFGTLIILLSVLAYPILNKIHKRRNLKADVVKKSI